MRSYVDVTGPLAAPRCCCIMALAMLLAGCHAVDPICGPLAGLVRTSDPATYHIEHWAEFTADSGQVNRLEIWLPLPLTTDAQTVFNLQISGAPARIYRDRHGRARVAVHQTTAPPGPGQSLQLRLAYDATRSAVEADTTALAERNFPDYDPRDVALQPFLRPEAKIQAAHSQIVGAARGLKANHTGPFLHARAAYDFVLERLSYQHIDGLGGALYAYRNRHGECGDYSALFVALCRAMRIPARPCVGFWANATDDWHVWAEFNLPGVGWVPVDPSKGDEGEDLADAFFGELDHNRITVAHSFDIHLAGKSGRHSVDFLQNGAWWWYFRGGPEPNVHCDFHSHGRPLLTTQ